MTRDDIGIPGNMMPNTPEAAARLLVRVYGEYAQDYIISSWQLLACFHIQDLVDEIEKIEKGEKEGKNDK